MGGHRSSARLMKKRKTTRKLAQLAEQRKKAAEGKGKGK